MKSPRLSISAKPVLWGMSNEMQKMLTELRAVKIVLSGKFGLK